VNLYADGTIVGDANYFNFTHVIENGTYTIDKQKGSMTAVFPDDVSYEIVRIGNYWSMDYTTGLGSGTASGKLTVITSSTPKHNVTFNLNDSDDSAEDIIEAYDGTSVAVPENPKRNGYTFTGWFTEPECETKYVFSTPVTGAFKLYAGWKAEEPIGDGIVFYADLDTFGTLTLLLNSDGTAETVGTGMLSGMGGASGTWTYEEGTDSYTVTGISAITAPSTFVDGTYTIKYDSGGGAINLEYAPPSGL
jgi:uncharacterized repeat protein (TIGR02543 family)